MMRNYIYILFFMIGAVYASAQNPPKITTTQIQNLIVDSTRINSTGDTAYYYQNGVLIGTGAIAGGGTTYNNISETVDTVFISEHLVVDTFTLFVDADSNRVGIGTSTPNGALEINAPITSFADRQFLIKDGNLDGFFAITEGSSSPTIYWPTFVGVSAGTADNGLGFIGAPESTQDIGNVDRAAIVFDAAKYTVATNSFSALVNTNLFTVRNWGTPAFTIAVDGGIFAPSLGSTTGVSANLRYNASGELLEITSSQRYKTNIKDYDRGISDLMKLRPVYFQPKNSINNNIFNTGFIAEEVEETGMVEYIDYDENGRANSIHYSLMTSLLTKAIQEQQTIIESQATEIETLKTLITDLSNRLQILENN